MGSEWGLDEDGLVIVGARCRWLGAYWGLVKNWAKAKRHWIRAGWSE